jgi:3-methyladenine DNA glycosylase/8-oxoguanine DNA glycosylase
MGTTRRSSSSHVGSVPAGARANSWRGVRVFTVGHSTRTLDELVALLRAFDVEVLADIRTMPRSRHNPQFNEDALKPALRSRRLRYAHLAELGGLRRSSKDSPNTGWRNASFRGYADHMLGADFEVGLRKLRGLAAEGRVALMCAEAVPWRCHRSLVADALTVRGAKVEHITTATRANPHRLTSFARVEGKRLTYPGDEGGRLLTSGPFHLEATVRVLQRRPTNRVDIWDERDPRYLRVLSTADGLALVEVANRGSIDEPEVRWRVLHGALSAGDLGAIEDVLRRVLGLDVDAASLQRTGEGHPQLAPALSALRGMRPPRFAGLFEAFANVVPFQQVSLDAGVAMVSKLVERFGARIEHEGRTFHAFPGAQSIAGARIDALKRCGLSLRKAEALRAVARELDSGALTEAALSSMTSTDALRHLTSLPGIGPWSASLILLRGLGRLDVFPPGEPGAARSLGGLARFARGPAFERLLRGFGTSRGYLYFCALGEVLLDKQLIHPAPA